MARLPRIIIPGIPQHVIQRGNNRQVCFYFDDCYAVYLDKLKEYSRKYDVAIHSFALMTPSSKTGISRMIQTISSYYVRYVNQAVGRTGTLWEGRYKSTLIDSENYFLTVSRYIELNPVRACMVDHPADYPWSSYRRNALGINTELITPHMCNQSLGNSYQSRVSAYQALFKHHIPEYTIKEIRDSINKSWVLGDNRFKAQIEEQTGLKASPGPRGGDRKSQHYRRQQDQ